MLAHVCAWSWKPKSLIRHMRGSIASFGFVELMILLPLLQLRFEWLMWTSGRSGSQTPASLHSFFSRAIDLMLLEAHAVSLGYARCPCYSHLRCSSAASGSWQTCVCSCLQHGHSVRGRR